jgi:hypothetical protein
VFSSLTKIRLASLFSLTETPKNFAAAFASWSLISADLESLVLHGQINPNFFPKATLLVSFPNIPTLHRLCLKANI